MLDFYFVADGQPAPNSLKGLRYAGGIEYDEFRFAQEVGLVESHADYYGKFRWSSAQVTQKATAVTTCAAGASANLVLMLREASTATLGLVAFGD